MGQYTTKKGITTKQIVINVMDEMKIREWGISKGLYNMPEIFGAYVKEFELLKLYKEIKEEDEDLGTLNWDGWDDNWINDEEGF
jgi:hypothetical protein